MLALSAAGFMATSTFGMSPGVEDLVVGDVDLERRHAGDRAGGRPDLGREVGQRGEVVAEGGAHVGEAVPGELHAVAGVAGEADHDLIERLGSEISGLGGHAVSFLLSLHVARLSAPAMAGRLRGGSAVARSVLRPDAGNSS